MQPSAVKEGGKHALYSTNKMSSNLIIVDHHLDLGSDDEDGLQTEEAMSDENPVDESSNVRIPTKIPFLTGKSVASDNLDNFGDTEEEVPMKLPRGYQIEMRLWMLTSPQNLLYRAEVKDSGMIVCMPTGTGKTYVGAMSLLDYIIANPKKRAMFIVDKVPLCNQQAEALRFAFRGFGRPNLKVKTLHGGRRCPRPYEFDVLVGVAESVCQHLKSENLKIQMFSLIAIDEIHHAVR